MKADRATVYGEMYFFGSLSLLLRVFKTTAGSRFQQTALKTYCSPAVKHKTADAQEYIF